jgi:hypothetical protein
MSGYVKLSKVGLNGAKSIATYASWNSNISGIRTHWSIEASTSIVIVPSGSMTSVPYSFGTISKGIGCHSSNV